MHVQTAYKIGKFAVMVLLIQSELWFLLNFRLFQKIKWFQNSELGHCTIILTVSTVLLVKVSNWKLFLVVPVDLNIID